MGLIGNGYRHNLTGRLFGATALDGGNPSILRSRTKPAYQRNIFVGEGINSRLASLPSASKRASRSPAGRAVADMLRPVRPLVDQAGLDTSRRQANLAGAYRARADADLAAGRAVLLLDDVVTTGATLAEAARDPMVR